MLWINLIWIPFFFKKVEGQAVTVKYIILSVTLKLGTEKYGLHVYGNEIFTWRIIPENQWRAWFDETEAVLLKLSVSYINNSKLLQCYK